MAIWYGHRGKVSQMTDPNIFHPQMAFGHAERVQYGVAFVK